MPPWRHRDSPEAVDLEILGSETTGPKIDPVCDPCPRHALETSGRTSGFASSPQLGLGACRASSLSLLLVRSFCLPEARRASCPNSNVDNDKGHVQID